MDCTDIIIGSARNSTSRVWDYYTRDRSTPRTDEFYGGQFDLTGATGFEKDGVTTIIFRRKLVSKDPTDHSIVDDLMSVIWARGQEPGKYVHSPPSGVEKDMASMKDFYQPDELKYHGHKMQRGTAQINFLGEFFLPGHAKNEFLNASFPTEPEQKVVKGSAKGKPEATSHMLDNDCRGFWKHPRDCVPDKHNCEYFARWETIGRGDEMRFHIETTHTNTWTGIGFSDDRKMPQTDAIIGWVDKNGRPFLMDAWMSGYQNPIIDSPSNKQDIYNTSGRIDNGVTTIEFTRKRETKDKAHDLSFTDEHCLYLVFPIQGGGFHEVNKKIRKHEQTPVVTESRVCIKSCGKELEEEFLATSTVAPDRLIYSVGVKLTNLAQSFVVPKKGSPEFDLLAGKVAESFNGVLNDIPGYYKTDVQMFNK